MDIFQRDSTILGEILYLVVCAPDWLIYQAFISLSELYVGLTVHTDTFPELEAMRSLLSLLCLLCGIVHVCAAAQGPIPESNMNVTEIVRLYGTALSIRFVLVN